MLGGFFIFMKDVVRTFCIFSFLYLFVSIENYEIRIFKFDFWPILTCMCRVSFLITLDIYKVYFKGRYI